jgi:hypothetical protein
LSRDAQTRCKSAVSMSVGPCLVIHVHLLHTEISGYATFESCDCECTGMRTSLPRSCFTGSKIVVAPRRVGEKSRGVLRFIDPLSLALAQLEGGSVTPSDACNRRIRRSHQTEPVPATPAPRLRTQDETSQPTRPRP